MSVYIIGVDPGDSTGIACFKDKKLLAAKQGSVDDMMTALDILFSKVKYPDTCMVACERFVSGRRNMTHQPTAQRVNGMVALLANEYGFEFNQQGPSDAWAIASNAALRKLGLHQSGTDVGMADANDANMAVRHALLLMARKCATTFTELMGPAIS